MKGNKETTRPIENPLYGGKFNRYGEVVKPLVEPKDPLSYRREILGAKQLTAEDVAVRRAENNFARIYDDVQFQTPGMRYIAETDTRLVEEWVGNLGRKTRVLDIGSFTGRFALPLVDAVGKNGKVFAIETASEYVDQLLEKAAQAGIDKEKLRVGIGDIQAIKPKILRNFIDGHDVDFITMMFGPLAHLMTEAQAVLNTAAQELKPGGSLLLSTNTLNGLGYRVPEAAIAAGADKDQPLGYAPSLFTRRGFSDNDSVTPNRMILGNGEELPAHFYDPSEVIHMVERAGLQIRDIRGISRLTGLFPAGEANPDELNRYITVVRKFEPTAAETMAIDAQNAQWVFSIAKQYDDQFMKDSAKLSEYTYVAVKAEKPEVKIKRYF